MREPRIRRTSPVGLSRLLMGGLIAGVILRALVVTSPGTPDVQTWKSWSYAASTDALGLYGVGGSPPERRRLVWGEIKGTTEYPPLALYELAAVGRVYRAIDPGFADSPALTALIKVPGLLAECLFVCGLLILGPRLFGQKPAQWMALALWLNPAVILNGAALGYLDTQMALPAAAALIALMTGRPSWAGVFIAVAVFTKPQALFVGPALLLALSRQTRDAIVPALARFGAAGLLATGAILLPILLNGAWTNMVQAVSRVAAHDMLSGYAMNVWWIVTWLVRASYGAVELGSVAYTLPVQILGITRFMEVGYPNPKMLAAVVVVSLVAWGCWRYRRAATPAAWAWVGAWTVFTYFVWNVQVHENHLYVAVPLLALAGAMDERYRRAFWIVSAITTLNMYVFYGFGPAPLQQSVIGRHWTGIDFSVVASFVVCGVWFWLTLKPPVPVERA